MKKTKAQEGIKKWFLKRLTILQTMLLTPTKLRKQRQYNHNQTNILQTKLQLQHQVRFNQNQIIHLAHSLFQKGTIEVKIVHASLKGLQNIIG